MTADLRVEIDRLLGRIEALGEIGAVHGPNGERGCARLALTDADRDGRDLVVTWMRDLDLDVSIDAIGNVVAIRPGRDPSLPVVMTGSHIDTVPEGGPLDGALGVLAGLECLQTIREARLPVRRPLAVVAWSDEEGRYGSLFGSRAFTGKLDAAQIPHLRALDGESLVDAMARAGYEAARAPDARCDPRALHAYVELHIEQGPHLEAARLPIGLVEGIVGIRRNRLTFVGEPDHAGTTPMAWRKDAFLAACEYALKAREHIVKKGSGRSVTNFGRIELAPGVSNIVPARYVIVCLRGALLQGRGYAELWPQLAGLSLLAVLIITATTRKFRRRLD